MKKFLALILTLALVMSMSVAAFAANHSQKDGTWDPAEDVVEENPVNVTVSSDSAKVYKVTIIWGDLTFEYAADGVWDPDTHTYEGDGAWQVNNDQQAITNGVQSTITVVNHSNAVVNAQASYPNTTLMEGVNIVCDVASKTLESAADYAYNQESLTTGEHTATITVSATGAPTNLNVGTTVLDKVTITITVPQTGGEG